MEDNKGMSLVITGEFKESYHANKQTNLARIRFHQAVFSYNLHFLRFKIQLVKYNIILCSFRYKILVLLVQKMCKNT